MNTQKGICYNNLQDFCYTYQQFFFLYNVITTYKTFPRPLQVKYGILLNQDESLDQFVPHNLNIEKNGKFKQLN